jgi:hypothetical protein
VRKRTAVMGSASRRELLLVGLCCVCCPPLAAQLRLPPPRIDSDAVEYYSHLRSLLSGRRSRSRQRVRALRRASRAPTRPSPRAPACAARSTRSDRRSCGCRSTRPGRRRTGVVPRRRTAIPRRTSGRCVSARSSTGSPASCCSSACLRELVPRGAAVVSTLLVLYGTFLLWYLVYEPLMSHAASFFMAALVLRVWWSGRDGLSLRSRRGARVPDRPWPRACAGRTPSCCRCPPRRSFASSRDDPRRPCAAAP